MNVTYVQIEIQEGVEGKKVRKKGKIDRWGNYLREMTAKMNNFINEKDYDILVVDEKKKKN